MRRKARLTLVLLHLAALQQVAHAVPTSAYEPANGRLIYASVIESIHKDLAWPIFVHEKDRSVQESVAATCATYGLNESVSGSITQHIVAELAKPDYGPPKLQACRRKGEDSAVNGGATSQMSDGGLGRPTVMLVMLVHNEATNMRRFLSSWASIADCYVLGVDRKTDDDSIAVAEEILGGAGLPGEVVHVTFHNFGQAMNTVLVAAKQAFYSSYVLIAEADWQAHPNTFESALRPSISESNSIVYNFRVHSRVEDTPNMHLNTSFREMSYMLPYGVPAFYRYRVHEQLHVAEQAILADGSRVVVGKASSGFVCNEFTGGSRQRQGTAHRLAGDLGRLQLDLEDDPASPRVNYYIGVSSYQLWSGSTETGGLSGHQMDVSPEQVTKYREMAVRHLSLCALHLCDSEQHRWQQVFSAQQLAMMYHFKEEARNLTEALRWYRHAMSVSSRKVELFFYVALLYLEPDLPEAGVEHAFAFVSSALQLSASTRAGYGGGQFSMHNPVFDQCLIPWLASKLARALAMPSSPSVLPARTLVDMAGTLDTEARANCLPHGVDVEKESSVENVSLRIQLLTAKWQTPQSTARHSIGHEGSEL